MNSKKFWISIILAVIVIIVLLDTIYMVNETEQVVITQFGKPVGEAVVTPGLKMKVPFIQKINVF